MSRASRTGRGAARVGSASSWLPVVGRPGRPVPPRRGPRVPGARSPARSLTPRILGCGLDGLQGLLGGLADGVIFVLEGPGQRRAGGGGRGADAAEGVGGLGADLLV